MDPPIPAPGDPADAATTPHRTLLARYRIERLLGSGGMGEVLLAEDTLLHRRVALKRLRPDPASHADRREAVLKEARRASRITDRRIAAIYDVIDLDDEVVIVMEFVDGLTLRQRIAGPMPLDEFWRLAPQCVEALGAAHAQGVIHRDIKPENLMVTRDGAIKILDFGIAKRSDTAVDEHATTVTETRHAIAGTPQYMAPEAHLGRRVDERADLYSLGVVFYELLTGARPFEGDGRGGLDSILHATPPPVSAATPAAGPALSAVVAKMLAKEPGNRFASAADLLRGLEAARRGEAPNAVVAATPALALRSRALAWTLGAALLVVAIAAALALWRPWERGWFGSLPHDRNLALLLPETPGADADFTSFALGATELLSSRLQRHTNTPGFQLASFADGFDENVRTATDARRILGATLALRTVIEQRTESLHARLELIETAHGGRLGTRDIDVSLARPFAFLDSTYAAATKLLRLSPSAPPDCGVRGAGTLRFYLEGLGRTRAAGASDETHHAIDVLELACNTEPEAAVSRAALATAQLKLNLQSSDASWLSAAEATAREAVALDSVRAEPHRALAAVFATQKRNDEALAEFARTVELNPTDDESCLRLGRVYHRLGRSEDERLAYLATSRARPHCWPPYWWLATFYFRESRLDEAVAAYDDMIRRAPAFYKGYSSLAGVLILRGEYPRAIQLLRQSIALRPTKIAFDNLGTAYFNSGRFAEAVDAYNQSFQFGFASYESWLNLGDAYYWLRNRKDNAAQAYVQAVRLGREERQKRRQSGHTEDVMILANLATVFPKLGQPDSARAYLRGALAADSTNPVVRYCAALTQWQLNDQSHAMTSLEAAVHGGYPVVWLRDSPVFSEWRELPAFRALVDSVGSKPQPAASSNRGG